MRKVVCGVLAFLAISAVAQVDKAEVTENPQTVCWEDSVKIYLERGRWNDKEALVKLAECYHKGNGVPQSSLGTIFMYMQVQEKGGMPVRENPDAHHLICLIYLIMLYCSVKNLLCLLLSELVEFRRKRLVGQSKDLRSEQTGILRTVDGHCRHRDACRHLNDGKK